MHPAASDDNLLPGQIPSFGKRTAAYVLDLLIIGGPVCILVALAGLLTFLVPAFSQSSGAVSFCLIAGGVFLWAVIPIYMLASAWQATPGMRIMKLILVTKAGERQSVKDTSERTSIAIMVSSFFLLGYLWALVDSQGRTLHDISSGTKVILRPELP